MALLLLAMGESRCVNLCGRESNGLEIRKLDVFLALPSLGLSFLICVARGLGQGLAVLPASSDSRGSDPTLCPCLLPQRQLRSVSEEKILIHLPGFLPPDRMHLLGNIYLTEPTREKPCSKALRKGKGNNGVFLVISRTSPLPSWEGNLMSMDLGELCLWPLENLVDSNDKKGKLRQGRVNEILAKSSY